MIFKSSRTGRSYFVGRNGGRLTDAQLARLFSAVLADDADRVIEEVRRSGLSKADAHQAVAEVRQEFRKKGGSLS